MDNREQLYRTVGKVNRLKKHFTHRTRLTVGLLACLLLASFTAAASAALPQVKVAVSPTVGGPMTRFVATFIVPRVLPGHGVNVFMILVHPNPIEVGCAAGEGHTLFSTAVRRVTLTFNAGATLPGRHHWCPGSYRVLVRSYYKGIFTRRGTSPIFTVKAK